MDLVYALGPLAGYRLPLLPPQLSPWAGAFPSGLLSTLEAPPSLGWDTGKGLGVWPWVGHLEKVGVREAQAQNWGSGKGLEVTVALVLLGSRAGPGGC